MHQNVMWMFQVGLIVGTQVSINLNAKAKDVVGHQLTLVKSGVFIKIPQLLLTIATVLHVLKTLQGKELIIVCQTVKVLVQ